MPETFMDKEMIVISQWKMGICSLGAAAALALSGCQKSENAGRAAPAPESAPASTASTTAVTGAAPASDTSKPPFGFLDTPKEGATVAVGSWAFGWGLDDSGIASVTVSTESGASSPVAVNQPFPGVAQSYPGFANADKAGFGFPVPRADPGIHTLTITLIAKDGGKTEIRRQIRVK